MRLRVLIWAGLLRHCRNGAGVFAHTVEAEEDVDEEDGWVAEQIRKVCHG